MSTTSLIDELEQTANPNITLDVSNVCERDDCHCGGRLTHESYSATPSSASDPHPSRGGNTTAHDSIYTIDVQSTEWQSTGDDCEFQCGGTYYHGHGDRVCDTCGHAPPSDSMVSERWTPQYPNDDKRLDQLSDGEFPRYENGRKIMPGGHPDAHWDDIAELDESLIDDNVTYESF